MPFQAGGWWQWVACSLAGVDHPEAATRLGREGRQGVAGTPPSVVSLRVNSATGEMTSPNGDFDAQALADLERKRTEILARAG